MQLRFNKNRFKTVAVLSGSVFLSVLITACLLYKSGFRYNMTASLPLGIWKIDKTFTHIERDDYVWFMPPKEISAFAAERGYLKNDTIPMLKLVHGLPGDTYSFFDDVVSINNTVIENAKRRQVDSKGRPMTQIEGGIVPEGQLFVLTPHSHSFDSRYFGPIPMANIIGTAQPVMVWQN